MSADDLELLIATGGRLVPLPAGTHEIDRPVLVTRSDVTIDGGGAALACSENHDGLVFCPPDLLAPPECWADLPGTFRQSFRTLGVAGLSFRGTPFDLGPAVIPGSGYRNPRGWGTVRRLQVDLRVRRNTPTWRTAELAGIVGPGPEQPAPWRTQVWDAQNAVRLLWRDSDGVDHVAACGIPAGNPEELLLTFRLNLDVGQWQVCVNEAWTGGVFTNSLSLDGDALGHAVVGHVSAGGQVADGPDVTYTGFRVQLDWSDPPAGAGWFEPTPDTLFLLGFDPPALPFVRWRSGAAGAGHPDYSGAAGYGLALLRADAEYRTTGVLVRDLDVTLPGFALYGFGVRTLPVLDFGLRDVRLACGAAGLGMPAGHTNSYPVTLTGLHCGFHGLTGVWADRAVLGGRDWVVKYARRNAVLFRDSAVRLDGLFYAASQDYAAEPIEDVCRFDRCEVVGLAGVSPNFEGSAPRRSYYRLTPSGEFATRAALTFCRAERAAGVLGPVPAVLLAETPGAVPGRCTLTESPPSYAGTPVTKSGGWL